MPDRNIENENKLEKMALSDENVSVCYVADGGIVDAIIRVTDILPGVHIEYKFRKYPKTRDAKTGKQLELPLFKGQLDKVYGELSVYHSGLKWNIPFKNNRAEGVIMDISKSSVDKELQEWYLQSTNQREAMMPMAQRVLDYFLGRLKRMDLAMQCFANYDIASELGRKKYHKKISRLKEGFDKEYKEKTSRFKDYPNPFLKIIELIEN